MVAPMDECSTFHSKLFTINSLSNKALTLVALLLHSRYYYDAETGFYYLNTRYYDPEIRRFVNADNYELLPELAGVYGQVNLYNYCNNNPMMCRSRAL